MRELTVIGAGGHAKVVISTARAAGWTISAVYDDDPANAGRDVLGAPIVGPAELDNDGRGIAAVIAVGANDARHRIARSLRCDWVTIVHPRAWIDDSVTLGVGTVVFAGAVIQPAARLGDHVIVNTTASIDHDSTIGDFAHLCPGSHLAGGATIGDGVLMGVGSGTIPYRSVGAWSIVGAGGAVVHDIPDRVVATGVPAKVRRSAPAPGE